MTVQEIEDGFVALEGRVQNIEANVVGGLTKVSNTVDAIHSAHQNVLSQMLSTAHDTANAINDFKTGNVPALITEVPQDINEFTELINTLRDDVNEIKSRVFGR